MKVMLQSSKGETFYVEMNPSDTLGNVRSKLHIDCGVNLDINQMEFKGKRVTESDSLVNFINCEIAPESDLHENIPPSNDLICSETMHCVVPGCGKSEADNPSKSYFILPSEEDRFHHWLLVCKRPDLVSINNMNHNYAVCEDHFIEDHFVDKSKQELKQDAIPTVFPFNHYNNTFTRIDGEDDILQGECEVLIKEEIPDLCENSFVDYSEAGTETLETMNKLCRLCASTISDVVYIFNDTGQEQEIAKKINSCLPVTVRSTDPLPKQLCTSCVSKLNLCHEFAEACIKAEDKLIDLNRRKYFMTHSVVNKKLENFVTKKEDTNLDDNGIILQNGTKVPELWDVKTDNIEMNCSEMSNPDCLTYCCPLCNEGNMAVESYDGSGIAISDIDNEEITGTATFDNSLKDYGKLYNVKCDSVWDANSIKYDCEVAQGEKHEVELELPDEISYSDGTGKLSCCICGDMFETMELCLSHSSFHFKDNIFPCSVCHLCFSSLSSFESHCEKIHNDSAKSKPRGSKRMACNSCGKRFNTEKTLKNHSCGSSPRPFKCEECGKYFLTEMRLLFHQQVHQGGSAVTCEYCGKIFSRENNLFDHVRLVHMGEKAHCCDQCGKTFQLKARLIAHQRVHTGERPFECDICGGKFYDKATLKGHRVTHLDVKPFQCEKCGRCFARKTLFKQHTSAHLSEECKRSRTYSCRICGGTVFSSYAKLVEHRKDMHPEAEMNEIDDSSQASKPFKCDDCGKSFAYRVTLVAHRRNHTGELPFQCEFCSKRFSQKRSLVLHRRTHTGEKPFVCLDCGKRFVQSAHLYSHMRLHTGEKPYSCEVCGESFRLKDVRDAHQRKHTGERPFKCNVCGKAFRTSHSYYQHMWIHQGKKPYPCTYCGKAFRRSNGLKIHIRIHTGEKPHSCDICGRSFAQKQDMKKHRNLHVAGKL